MTVAELIGHLQACDPAKPVVIHDADTDWWLHLREVVDRGPVLEVSGTYGDMFDQKCHEEAKAEQYRREQEEADADPTLMTWEFKP